MVEIVGLFQEIGVREAKGKQRRRDVVPLAQHDQNRAGTNTEEEYRHEWLRQWLYPFETVIFKLKSFRVEGPFHHVVVNPGTENIGKPQYAKYDTE